MIYAARRDWARTGEKERDAILQRETRSRNEAMRRPRRSKMSLEAEEKFLQCQQHEIELEGAATAVSPRYIGNGQALICAGKDAAYRRPHSSHGISAVLFTHLPMCKDCVFPCRCRGGIVLLCCSSPPTWKSTTRCGALIGENCMNHDGDNPDSDDGTQEYSPDFRSSFSRFARTNSKSMTLFYETFDLGNVKTHGKKTSSNMPPAPLLM